MVCEACDFLPGAGFGSGGFGSVAFGSATADGLRVISAHAISANAVRVKYGGEIVEKNQWFIGSPLYPPNWTLIAIEPLNAKIRLCQSVVLGVPGELTLFFDGILPTGALFEVLLTDLGVVLTGCDCAVFRAVLIAPTARQGNGRGDDGFIRDIANPSTQRDSLPLQPLGTYQITDSGDLAQDITGIAGLRKRINRRITTGFGDFYHLPSYGVNARVKTLLTPDVVRRLQSDLAAQVRREPEVLTATVTLSGSASAPNVVFVRVTVATRGSSSPTDVLVPISLP